MTTRTHGRRSTIALVASVALTLSTGAIGWAANDVLDPSSDLHLDLSNSLVDSAANLTGQAQADALLLASIPAATWLTQGTPAEIQERANDVVTAAAAVDEVPTLVAYNIPFRDCALYSAGGATSVADYEAWIDAVAAGIGAEDAVVLLEPDGLGVIPWNTDINGNPEWCQPADVDPATAVTERYAMMNYAVDVFAALPSTAVYLDGTNSAWLGVGDNADRLTKAGVAKADGFFLNVSNYQYTENAVQYGTWVSQCLAMGDFVNCANQYWNGGPDDTMIADLLGAWTGVALDRTGIWSDTAPEPELNSSGVNARFAGAVPTTHFVVDTSRNGLGPWVAPAGAYTDAQDWCNPPDRGLGMRPTTDTGNDLVDAFMWIKIPGESDGLCLRGTAGPEDPERGMIDPAAGAWFTEQARELIELAVPPVAAQTCEVSYTTHDSRRGTFTAQIRVRNTGTTTIRGWELAFAFGDNQTIRHDRHSQIEQVGSVVTVSSERRDATIRPGARTTINLTGRTNRGPNSEPLLFVLNGGGCTLK